MKAEAGADVDAAAGLRAGTLDVDGGAVDAATVVAKVDVGGGAVRAATSVTGDVEVDGEGSTLEAAKVDGRLTQNGGTVTATADNLEITGNVTQNGGVLGQADQSDSIKVGGDLTQDTAGTINANRLDVTGTTSFKGKVNVKEIRGDIVQNEGTMAFEKIDGTFTQNNGTMTTGEVTSDVTQNKGQIEAKDGVLKIGGKLTQKADGKITATTSLTLNGGAEQENGATITAPTLNVAGTDKDVSLVSGDKNDFATVQGTAKNLTVKDKNEINLGNITAEEQLTVDVKGAVSVNGVTVVGKTGVTVDSGDAVTVNGGTVKAGAFEWSGTGAPVPEAADKADLTVTAKNGVEVKGGAAMGASQRLTLQKSADAAGGDISVTGSKVAANGDLKIDSAKIVSVDGSTLAARGKEDITGATGVTVNNATVESVGNLTVTATKGDVVAKGASKLGTNGKLTVNAVDGSLKAQDTAVLTAGGEGDFDGKAGVEIASGAKVLTKGNAAVDSTDGAVTVNGTVKASAGDVVVTAKNEVGVTGTAVVEAGNAVTVKSTGAGDITVDTTETVSAKNGAVKIENADGAVTIKNATVEAKGATGDVDVNATTGVTIQKDSQDAKLLASQDVTVGTTGGDIRVEDRSKVGAANGKVAANADGAITISGAADVDAKKTVGLTAGTEVKVAETAKVNAGEAITATAQDGDVVVDGSADMTARKGVTLTASKGVDILGDATVKANGGDAVLTAQGEDVKVTGDVAASASVAVDANTTVEVSEDGTVKAGADMTVKAPTIAQDGGLIEAASAMSLDGSVQQNAGTIQAAHLTLKNGDVIQAGDAAKIKTSELTFDNSKKIALISNNNEIDKVSGNLTELDIFDKDDLSIGQLSVSGALKVKTGGSTKVDGNVTAGSTADIDASRNVEFVSGGKLSANTAKIKAGANITQAGASVSVTRGYVTEVRLNAAVQAGSTELMAGGNIGNGTYNYVTVGGGTVKTSAGSDASIASAGSENLRISSASGRNVSLYTAGKLITDGPVTSQSGNTTVTAKEFGGIVQSAFGSSLTVNNFNNGVRPLLAIFETNGGNKTPKINNQPNDTIVFIDGRLAGGDIQVINKLGALEAFPVQTPELKSEQGVFGNPNFLHDELDVANPFAVGAIDFLLQDIPLLTLTSDFPMEVDKQVAANWLSPTTSYWFGQNPRTESEKMEDVEEKNDEGASSDGSK